MGLGPDGPPWLSGASSPSAASQSSAFSGWQSLRVLCALRGSLKCPDQLPSILHFYPSAVECGACSCSCHVPARDAAMEVLVEELGMWRQEEDQT